jgi:hypothetical protein
MNNMGARNLVAEAEMRPIEGGERRHLNDCRSFASRTSVGATAALTWVEIIVCVAILGVLSLLIAPVFFREHECKPGPHGMISRRVREIVYATKNYIEDHGHPPRISAALAPEESGTQLYAYGDMTEGGCKVANSELFDVLRAIDRGANAGHALNPRKQRYIEAEKAARGNESRDGFIDGDEFPAHMRGQLLDKWGKQYCILVDADGDGCVNVRAFFKDLTDQIRSPVVAFSMGEDRQIGGSGYRGSFRYPRMTKAPDDFVSWE